MSLTYICTKKCQTLSFESLSQQKSEIEKKRANILYVPACYHIKNIMFNDPQNKQLVLHAQGARSFPYLLSCYLFQYTYLYLYKAVSKVARKEAKEEGGAIVNYSDKPSHAGDGFYGNRIRQNIDFWATPSCRSFD